MHFPAFSFLLVVCLMGMANAAETYSTKYENVNLDEILNNDRLYRKYFDCLINKGKCSADVKELKDNLPEALATECKKCTEKQKDGAEKVLRYVLEKKPEDYALLEKIYDPEGTYKKKYSAEAEKRGIKIN